MNTCRACGVARPLSELLSVTAVNNPSVQFFVCRPSITDKGCFGTVGRASVHRISLAQEWGRGSVAIGPPSPLARLTHDSTSETEAVSRP